MTPEDIKRLDELHAKTTQGEWSADIGSSPLGQTGDFEPYADIKCHGEIVAYFNEMAGVALRTGIDVQEGNTHFTAAIKNAWPAISAELTRLREFEAEVRDAMAGAKHDYERVGEVSIAIYILYRKRGEHDRQA